MSEKTRSEPSRAAALNVKKQSKPGAAEKANDIDALSSRGSGLATSASEILFLQQTQGNRFTRQIIEGAARYSPVSQLGPSQVQLVPTTASTEVPALSSSTVNQVKTALQLGTDESRQNAVTLMVDSLISSGVIDAQRLENRKMLYQPGFAPSGQGYGLTSLTPGTALPRACRVRIGDGALSSASVLYSTIMHEYQHVNQYWDNTGVSEAISEIEAYLYEIEHLRESGLNTSITQLIFLRRQLMAYWERAASNAEARAPYQQRYNAALTRIEDRLREIQLGK